MESVGDFEYNTKDLIGHGAFAVVFKGRQKKNHSFVVAIKSITKKNLSKSQNLLGKEIKILKELTELHHENVVALLDCKETPNYVYLVMEYCNGGDLADYLHVKGTLSEDTIRLFLRQLAGAMRALNAKGIIHRDLKPQNILLCHSGKTNSAPHEIRLKIADFGFARFLQEGVMAATLCGSPMYMAPEVIMSLQYDAKADLWSIGTIVFQCLTGKAPFQAQTPQALKAFYEKNVNLAPKILPGTSNELSDLLVKLLKRNAKDRLDFDEFFAHPFLKIVTKPTSPVPVPARQRSLSHEMSPSPMKPLTDLPPPAINPRTPSRDLCEDLSGEAVASSQLGSSPYDPGRYSPLTKGSGSPSSIEDPDDFVLVPNNLVSDNSGDSFHFMNHKRKSSEAHCSSPMTVGTPSKVSTVAGSPSSGGMPYHHRRHSASPSSPRPSMSPSPRPSASPSSPRPSYLPVANSPNTCQMSEPIPVPGQRAAYEQIQRSLRQSPVAPPDIKPSDTSVGSPSRAPNQWASKPVDVPHSKPIGVRADSTESLGRMTPDISSLSPPPVQFAMGTSPGAVRRPSVVTCYSNMGTPPPASVWSCSPQHCNSGRQTPTNSPIRKTSSVALNSPPINSNYFLSGNALPSILGSPSNQPASLINCNNLFTNRAPPTEGSGGITSPSQPLMVPFAMRAHTIPDFSPKDASFGGSAMEIGSQESAFFPRSFSAGKLTDTFGNIRVAFGVTQKGYCGTESPPPNSMMPYGGHGSAFMFGPESCCGHYRLPFSSTMLCNSPTSSGNHQYHFGTSPPNMECPMFFMAPELPQETLLEREHNDTLAKLNYVLALVGCIVDLAKAKSTPIAALTESAISGEGNQQDPPPVVTESYRRAEQLVLYIRALQMLSSSLNLSREELKTGRLQPSNSVKNVVSNMNEKYHFCLQMCKSLNSQNLLQTVRSDPKTSSITADKLIYNYALHMCQSAALDELFGNPQECFRRYQIAQLLLHNLTQQIINDDDRHQLCRQKNAVEKRLYVLQQQGYIYSYNTSCTT